MEIDTRNKDAFESFCERMFNTGRPSPEKELSYKKHIELINKAWAEVLEHPQSGHGFIIGTTGAGKTPSFMLDAIKKEMGILQKEFKHPNEIILEKVNASIE